MLDVEREFNDVRFVCDAYLRLQQHGIAGEIYNISSGHPVTLHTLLDTLVRLTGHVPHVEIDPSLVSPNEVHSLCGDPSRLWGDPRRPRHAPPGRDLEVDAVRKPAGAFPSMIRVAFGATALLGPMSGVGQYAYHLAKGLQNHPDVDLTCFYGKSFDRDVSPGVQRISGALRTAIRKYVPFAYGARRLLEQTRFDRGRRELQLRRLPRAQLSRAALRRTDRRHGYDLSWIRFPDTHPLERVRAMDRYFEPVLRRASLILTDSAFVKLEVLEVYGGDPDRVVPVSLGA